jgi:putative membrane protein
MLKIFYYAVGLLLFLAALSFAAINHDTVVIDYYFGRFEMALSLLLVTTFGLGAGCGLLAALGRQFRLQREIGRLRRSHQLAEEEVRNLRALPLKDVR